MILKKKIKYFISTLINRNLQVDKYYLYHAVNNVGEKQAPLLSTYKRKLAIQSTD